MSVAQPAEMAVITPGPAAEPISPLRETVASAALPASHEQEPLPSVASATPVPNYASTPEAASAPTPVPAATGSFMVQAATFSTEERATRAAATLGGVVTPSGNLFRVRTGPFPSRNAAEASLANVRAAGYSDARILTGG